MEKITTEQGLQYVTQTDVGLRRANNQDAMGVMMAGDVAHWARRGHIFLVADGMGAHAAGELASKMAADGVPHTYSKLLDLAPPDAIRQAIIETNQQIYNRGHDDPEFHGMGTTCSALLIVPQGALVAHVGDSRVYRLRGELYEQLTFDHSLVWELQKAGQFGEDETPAHVPKNIITRSLGPNAGVHVDLEGPFALELDDIFLLCSDGLSGQVSDEEMGNVLGALPLDEAAQALIDIGNLRGGPDNITLLLIRVVEQDITRYAAEPFTVASEEAHRPALHPAVWITLGVCLLVTAGLFVAKQWWPTVLAGAAAAATAALAIAKKLGPRTVHGYHVAGGHLGEGPHRKAGAKPTAASLRKFSDMTVHLRKVAEQQNWEVEWDDFNRLEAGAKSAAEKQDYQGAVAEYCRAISSMMEQLRP
ncbi:MAG: serine/threonine-protein phosphatase [Planctomycetes bacterium]|nr:serine/threonine-protein phosphatase [Planctomycetota bacterium]